MKKGVMDILMLYHCRLFDFHCVQQALQVQHPVLSLAHPGYVECQPLDNDLPPGGTSPT